MHRSSRDIPVFVCRDGEERQEKQALLEEHYSKCQTEQNGKAIRPKRYQIHPCLIQLSSWKHSGEGEACLCSCSRRRNEQQRLWDVSVYKQQTRRSFRFQRFPVATERLQATMNSMMFISVLIYGLIRLNGQWENSWERKRVEICFWLNCCLSEQWETGSCTSVWETCLETVIIID